MGLATDMGNALPDHPMGPGPWRRGSPLRCRRAPSPAATGAETHRCQVPANSRARIANRHGHPPQRKPHATRVDKNPTHFGGLSPASFPAHALDATVRAAIRHGPSEIILTENNRRGSPKHLGSGNSRDNVHAPLAILVNILHDPLRNCHRTTA